MPTGNEPTGAGADPTRDVHENVTVVRSRDVDLEPADRPEDASRASEEVADLAEFSHSLVEIGLISDEELQTFAASSAEGVLGLSRALVKAGKLTPYQAAAVYQGKSRGLLIGNYLILDKLGQGGMGVVFKARHSRLGKVGASKSCPRRLHATRAQSCAFDARSRPLAGSSTPTSSRQWMQTKTAASISSSWTTSRDATLTTSFASAGRCMSHKPLIV